MCIVNKILIIMSIKFWNYRYYGQKDIMINELIKKNDTIKSRQ